MLPIAKRLPRWLAILILYVAILGTSRWSCFLIFPPLVQQAQALWARSCPRCSSAASSS